MLSEKPRAAKTAKVPTSDTGMAAIGMIEARQVCRNRMTTSTTSTIATTMAMTTSWTDWVMNTVASYWFSYATPGGKSLANSAMVLRISRAVVSSFEAGWR